MKNTLYGLPKDFLLAVFAGISIALGGVAFLSVGAEGKIIGALFFTVGLFIILNFDFNLFTGKVCYALDNKPDYLLRLVVIWLGNLCGAFISAAAINLTRLTSLSAYCSAVVQAKLSDEYSSLFILGIFCNMLIYLAVHGYKNFRDPVAKIFALFFGVSVFVLCGFEHCVADMFYFSLARAWSWDVLLRLVIITLGNVVGGLLIPALFKITSLKGEKKE